MSLLLGPGTSDHVLRPALQAPFVAGFYNAVENTRHAYSRVTVQPRLRFLSDVALFSAEVNVLTRTRVLARSDLSAASIAVGSRVEGIARNLATTIGRG